MTVAQNVAFPLRQHTPPKTAEEIRQFVLVAAGRGRPAGGRDRPRSRPSFPAACGNASAWPAPWPWSRKSCSTTSRPPGLDPIMSDVINELILSTRRQHPVTSVRGDARHADGAEGGRSRGDALSAGAAGQGRAADHLRRAAANLDGSADRRVRQFVRGEAGERLMETAPRVEAESWTNGPCNFASA